MPTPVDIECYLECQLLDNSHLSKWEFVKEVNINLGYDLKNLTVNKAQHNARRIYNGYKIYINQYN